MITYLSADNGKLQLHDDTKNGVIFESNDPLALAKAFVKFGMPEDRTFRCSSSFDFGIEKSFSNIGFDVDLTFFQHRYEDTIEGWKAAGWTPKKNSRSRRSLSIL